MMMTNTEKPKAEGCAPTIDGALAELVRSWDGHASIAMHSWGVLTLNIRIAGHKAIFEIADPDLLDAIDSGNTGPLITRFAADMDLEETQVEQILEASTDVTLSVDRIRSRQFFTDWKVAPGLESKHILSEAGPSWARLIQPEQNST